MIELPSLVIGQGASFEFVLLPQDENFKIDSDVKLKIIEDANCKSVPIDLQRKDTDEFVDVEKR